MTIAEQPIKNSINNILDILYKCRENEPSDSWDDIQPTEVIFEHKDFALIGTNNDNGLMIYIETRPYQISRIAKNSSLEISPIFFPEYFFSRTIDDLYISIVDHGSEITDEYKSIIKSWNKMVLDFEYEKIHEFVHQPFSEDPFESQFCSFLKKSFTEGYLVTYVNPEVTFYKEGTGFFTIAPLMTRFSNPEKLLKIIEDAAKESVSSEEDEEEGEEGCYDDEQQIFVLLNT